jgi:ATP-dependent protease ClpP protease subunit
VNRFSPRALARGRELAQRAHALAGQARDTKDPKAREWFRFENATGEDGTETTVIYIYDMIDSWGGYWGISAQEFIQQLMAVTTPTIELRVNSPGGEVFEAVAMFSVLESHPATVTAYVDGLAASAASFLIMAAEKVVMHRNAELMIHDAHGVAIGNAAVMDEMREILDKISDNIASIYAEKAGGTVEEWRAVMIGEGGKDGRWYSAQEALDAGLIDEISERAGSGETDAGNTTTSGRTQAGTPTTPSASATEVNPGESTEDEPDPDSTVDSSGVDSVVAPDPQEESTVDLPEDVNIAALIRSAFPNTKEAVQ